MKPHGRASLWHLQDGAALRHLATVDNLRVVTWGFIAAQLLRRRVEYAVSAVYVEYENVTNPGTPISPPAFTATDGKEYYQGLAAHPSKDYLRIPVQTDPTLGILPGYESYFTDGVSGNKLTYLAMTSGTLGVHGKAFSHTAISKVYGLALVAAPVWTDPSQDVLFARAYYSAQGQPVKPATGQLAVTWEIGFPVEGVA